jgi:hypothetical protein
MKNLGSSDKVGVRIVIAVKEGFCAHQNIILTEESA